MHANEVFGHVAVASETMTGAQQPYGVSTPQTCLVLTQTQQQLLTTCLEHLELYSDLLLVTTQEMVRLSLH